MSPPLVVSVDVEGGDGADPYRSVDALTGLLADLELPVTMFVTPDVVEARADTIAGWLADGHEVGLHVHPARLGGGSDWLTDYDRDAIEGFLAGGAATFEDRIDHSPRSFRAGRWEFSEALLSALETRGFDRDASLRPDAPTEAFTRGEVTEYPLTVYSNPLVSLALTPWDIESVPLHADAFLASLPLVPAFYGVTARVLAGDRDYVMVSLHDYDVIDAGLRDRLGRYVRYLAARTAPQTLSALDTGK